jgi:hypothetical protein
MHHATMQLCNFATWYKMRYLNISQKEEKKSSLVLFHLLFFLTNSWGFFKKVMWRVDIYKET